MRNHAMAGFGHLGQPSLVSRSVTREDLSNLQATTPGTPKRRSNVELFFDSATSESAKEALVRRLREYRAKRCLPAVVAQLFVGVFTGDSSILKREQPATLAYELYNTWQNGELDEFALDCPLNFQNLFKTLWNIVDHHTS